MPASATQSGHKEEREKTTAAEYNGLPYWAAMKGKMITTPGAVAASEHLL